MQTIMTPVTRMLGMTNPVMLAGMNQVIFAIDRSTRIELVPSNVPLQASGPDLAAAVSNAGGIGVIGPPFLLPSAHICRCFRHGRPRSTDTAA